MTLAVLSFATRKTPVGAMLRVKLRCDELALDEGRDVEPNQPFANWTRAYETGHWTSEGLLGIGLAIGNWLDGPQRWLSRLAQATAPVILVIETTRNPDSIEQAAFDAPWELIACVGSERERCALAPQDVDERIPVPLNGLLKQLGPVDWQYVHHMAFEPSLLLSVVRRLGSSTPPLEPSKYRLSVVFMPCQPDGSVGLSVGVQELAIRKATDNIEMQLAIEDSGSLRGLGDLIARLGEYDVLQVTCPATIAPSPALAFEGARGERVDVSAGDIWEQVANIPRLLIVSAYGEATAGPTSTNRWAQNASTVAVESGVLWPLSTELCRRGWPAVIGLAGATADQVEIDFAAALYRLLAQHVSLLDAFARARPLMEDAASGTLWHRVRLVLGPGGGGPLVASADANPTRALFIQNKQFLDPNGQIRIATDYQTSLHRRAFQSVLAMLRDVEFPGIVVHGSDEISRASFVSRVLQSMEHELRRVVLTFAFDAATILQTIREQTAHPAVGILAKQYRDKLRNDPSQLQDALRAIVEGPCRDSGGGAFVLVLHNFDPASGSDHAVVLRTLLGAFAGANTASRLLITCDAPFSVIDDEGIDISRRLAWQSLEVGTRRLVPAAPGEPARPVVFDTSSMVPPPPIRQRLSQRRRVLMAGLGIALAGLGVVLFVIRTRAVLDAAAVVDRGDARGQPAGEFEVAGIDAGVDHEHGRAAAVAVEHADGDDLGLLRDAEDRASDVRAVALATDADSAVLPGMVRFEATEIYMGVLKTRPTECTQALVEEDCKELLAPERYNLKHVAAFDLDQKEVTNGEFYDWLYTNRNNWLPIGADGVVWDRDDNLPVIQTKSCVENLTIISGRRAQMAADASRLPVTCVTWYGATKYCRDLTKRLPGESEWELAAKGVDGRPFPWGSELPRADRVAYELDRPRAVGASRQDLSPEGIYDLAGNVTEWVQSDHATPDIQVVRGGSFSSKGPCPLLGVKCARVAWRGFFGRNVGFRCARDLNRQ